jgi:hypothetical protein
LETVRKQAGKVYEDVKHLVPGGELRGLKVKTVEKKPLIEGRHGDPVPGPLQGLRVNVKESRGGDPIEQLKQARADAAAEYRHYDVSKDPADLKKAQAHWAQAESLDDTIAASLKAKGREDLVQALTEARTKIAKSYDVERALNLGTGDVAAQIIGRQLDKGGLKSKTGELSTIGKMAESFPSVMREGGRVPSPGVSGTDATAAALLGTLGYGVGGPAGLVAAGLPLLRGPARNLVLSPFYQRFATSPGMKPPVSETALRSALLGRAIAERDR